MHEDKIICLYFGISPISWETLKERLRRYLMEGNPNTVYILTFGSNMKSRMLLVLSSKLGVLLRVKGIHYIFRLIMFGIITKADCLHCSYSLPEEYSQIKPGRDLDYNTGVAEPAVVTTVSLFPALILCDNLSDFFKQLQALVALEGDVYGNYGTCRETRLF